MLLSFEQQQKSYIWEKRTSTYDIKRPSIGKTATVTVVGGEGALRQHFLDMGIIPMADVTMVKYAPMGDPVEVRIHSYELTLRLADAARFRLIM